MKYIFITIGFLFGLQTYAQGIEDLPISTFGKAKIQLDQNHPFYNPSAGFLSCKKAAEEEQNSKAMNLLAILYSQGIGIEPSQVKALEWFKAAAENGYHKSWYNVGLMHKNGYGTDQDFEKAFEYYSKGSEIGSSSSMYGKGYLLYKGLGCKQSYPEAIKLFKKTVGMGNLGSMYLLGLCYRNGYGIEKDQDSARYWLTKATDQGYELARREMMETKPELDEYPSTKKSYSTKKSVNDDLIKTHFEEVKQTFTSLDQVTGHYMGYLVTYDWSGKHIISNDALELEIAPSETKNTFKGTWIENKDRSVSISGQFKESNVIFDNTSYYKTDHYSSKTPIEFLFKDATFTSVTYNGSTFLIGNLQLWDAERNEPEKPMYISLVKNDEKKENLKSFAMTNDLTVVPNPFENSFSFNLSLEQDVSVVINLYSMGGSIIYTEKLNLPKGNHKHTVEVDVPSGSYVLKVSYGSETKSTIILKS